MTWTKALEDVVWQRPELVLSWAREENDFHASAVLKDLAEQDLEKMNNLWNLCGESFEGFRAAVGDHASRQLSNDLVRKKRVEEAFQQDPSEVTVSTEGPERYVLHAPEGSRLSLPTKTLRFRGEDVTFCTYDPSGLATLAVALLALEDPRIDEVFLAFGARLEDANRRLVWPKAIP